MHVRVAYLINQYPKVSHTFIRREIQALERLGVEVPRYALRGWDTLCPDPADHAERERTRYVLRNGVRGLLGAVLQCALRAPGTLVQALGITLAASRGSGRGVLRHLVSLAEACQLRLWLAQARVDHLHVHFGTNGADVALLVTALGGPTFSMTVHGPEEFDRPVALDLAGKVRAAALVVAISSFARSQVFRWVEAAQWSKVRIVHCGLEPGFHASAGTDVPDRQRLVCVGRLSEEKGHLLLLEAAAMLVREGLVFELVLAGDGPLRGRIEQAIAVRGLQQHVTITGWISSAEVRDLILGARALVQASFAEGLPVVLMEAMALRRPVLACYLAAIPELVVPGLHGWLYPAGSVTALGHAMRECLLSPVARLSAMGLAARERVLARHDADVGAARLRQCFEQICEVAT